MAGKRAGGGGRGFALPVGLLVLVLLSGLTLAFLAFAQTQRRLINSSAAIVKVEELSGTALDSIIGDLLDEIVAGSDPASSNALYPRQPYYIPRPVGVVPQRAGDFAVPNLVKTSQAGMALWKRFAPDAPDGRVRALAENDTAVPSRNGIAVSAARWLKSGLMGPELPAPFDSPDWILITRRGPLEADAVPGIAAMRDGSSDDYVVGRYAYAVFDVGGLVDITAAGNLLGREDNSRRFRANQIDLGALPGIENAAALVAWRDLESWARSPDHLLDPRNLFQMLMPRQQTFVNRQDLIRFQKAHSGWLKPGALEYLTVFSRSLNRPYFKAPDQASLRIPDAIASKSPDVRYDDPSTHRNPPFLFDARRPNGDPVMKNRFPLPRLAFFEDPAAHENGIRKYFGLERSSDGYSWVYRGAKDSPIKTLAEVAVEQPAREPDFFEVLQAAVLGGSLGQGGRTRTPFPAGASWKDGESMVESRYRDNDVSRHVFQLGVNLIDQYDRDDFPTVLARTTPGKRDPSKAASYPVVADVAGIENLPYLSEVACRTYRLDQMATEPLRAEISGWFHFELWNPHQNAAQVGDSSADGPARLRVVMTEGEMALRLNTNDEAGKETEVATAETVEYGAAYQQSPDGTPYQIQFANSPEFKDPRFLMPGKYAAWTPGPHQEYAEEGESGEGQIGILVGRILQFSRAFTHNAEDPIITESKFLVQNDSLGRKPTFELQFRDRHGRWRTYQRFANFGDVVGTGTGYITLESETDPGRTGLYKSWTNSGVWWRPYARLDPRGERFGLAEVPALSVNQPLLPGQDSPQNGQPDNDRLFVPNTFSSKWYGNQMHALAENLYRPPPNPGGSTSSVGSRQYMADRDGVVRRGDADHTVPGAVVDPLDITAPDRLRKRPLVLNRPFRSVGEMGYAFRDLPWKTLDFSGRQLDPDGSRRFACSADGALLEFFTCEDPYGSQADRDADRARGETAVLRGKIHLNTRHPEVLAAAMAGARRVERQELSPVPAADRFLDDGLAAGSSVLALARKIVESTRITADAAGVPQGSPFVSRADLARVLAGDAAAELEAISRIKAEKEAVVRALADLGDAQTWNLMIDVIVQSGRYPPHAADPGAGSFLVEGERQYWLHVAIDRATGRVVDRLSEIVDE